MRVDITDSRGVVVSKRGNGLYRNGVEVTATATELNQYSVTGKVVGLNTGSSHVYIVIPVSGTLKAVYSSVSGNPGAETLLRVHNGAGSSLGDVTIENGSTAGSVDSLTGLTEALSAGGYVRIISNNGASNAVDAFVTLLIER